MGILFNFSQASGCSVLSHRISLVTNKSEHFSGYWSLGYFARCLFKSLVHFSNWAFCVFLNELLVLYVLWYWVSDVSLHQNHPKGLLRHSLPVHTTKFLIQ